MGDLVNSPEHLIKSGYDSQNSANQKSQHLANYIKKSLPIGPLKHHLI